MVGTRETRTDAPISYDVPQRAIKEAIVNAVAHRDYYSNGSVEVRVFSDRVEILNPGELPPGKDVAWLWGEHVSIPANPLIAEAFYQTRYIDRAGSGIDDMTDACRSDGLPPPQIKVEYQSFVTVLRRQIHGENPMKNTEKNAEDNMVENTVPITMSRGTVNGIVNDTVNEAEQLFAAIKDNPGHRMPFFVDLLKKSDRTLKRYLVAELKDLVEFRGAPKTGGYYVKEAKHD